MIEYVIIAGICVIGIFFIAVVGFILYKKDQNNNEIAYNKYKLERRKLYTQLKLKNKASANDLTGNEDAEDFIESLPSWLSSIATGANIDLEAVYDGDPEELRKIKDLLDKNLPKSSSNTSSDDAIR